MAVNGTTNGNVDYSIHPLIAEDKITLYVKTGNSSCFRILRHYASHQNAKLGSANATNTANTLKPLILIEALQIPHHIHIIMSTSNETWFHKVNPYKMVPAMEDVCTSSGTETKKWINVFDSSACLTYLAEKWDEAGMFSGTCNAERGSVQSWLMGYTAGLG